MTITPEAMQAWVVEVLESTSVWRGNVSPERFEAAGVLRWISA